MVRIRNLFVFGLPVNICSLERRMIIVLFQKLDGEKKIPGE